MPELSQLQKDAILIALQFHAALIQQTIQDLQPKPNQVFPKEDENIF